jgi:type II secretory pathway pseudopilin PulG
MARSVQIQGRSTGLTLLELSVVLVLIAAVAAGSMAMLTASIQTSQYNVTVARMQAIESALLTFRQAFNRLPCPGDLTVVPSDGTTGTCYATTQGGDYGMEAGQDANSAIATATGACTGTNMTPQANFTATGTNTGYNGYTVVEGAVPTRALKLPDSYMYDGWGNKFRYAVDARFTAASAFSTYPVTQAVRVWRHHGEGRHGGDAQQSVGLCAHQPRRQRPRRLHAERHDDQRRVHQRGRAD